MLMLSDKQWAQYEPAAHAWLASPEGSAAVDAAMRTYRPLLKASGAPLRPCASDEVCFGAIFSLIWCFCRFCRRGAKHFSFFVDLALNILGLQA